MTELAGLRCLNHPGREAVARCPSCRNFFCRECITEHEGKVLCASCLARLTAEAPVRGRSLVGLVGALRLALGLASAWLFFFLAAKALVSLPTSFHEGTIWHTPWLR